jgi:hemerythrin superfamily protein
VNVTGSQDTRGKDAVDLLTAQHERIRTLFREFEGADGEAKQEKFEELRRLLAVHETAEELVTHPNARLAEGGNDVVDARLEEETEAKKMLADLDGMKVDDAGFAPKFGALKAAVLAHAEAEESQEFPLLRQHNDQAMLDRMATAVRAAEAVAPTHPHPSAGSSMTTNLMAGPLASVLDRTRDAVRKALG